jgi:23S rRNA (guanosine2251-2'-O)-methyltransferase
MRVIYGVNPVKELLRGGGEGLTELWLADGIRSPVVTELERQARAAGAQVRHAPRPKLDKLAGADRHQGVVAVLSGDFRYVEVEEILEAAKARGEPPLLVILDGVEDPQHLGAIIRSAVALGAHGVVIPRDRAVGVTPVVVKASAGVIERCRLARVTNISRIIGPRPGERGGGDPAAGPHHLRPRRPHRHGGGGGEPERLGGGGDIALRGGPPTPEGEG